MPGWVPYRERESPLAVLDSHGDEVLATSFSWPRHMRLVASSLPRRLISPLITLTFSEHVANLTRSSYFHLRRLRAIRRSVSSHVFTSIVHAFVCSRIDYCNSLLVGLPKVRLSPI